MYIDKLSVHKNCKLDEFKEIISSMAYFTDQAELPIECFRIRLKQSSGYFGKILRDNTKTLK